MGENNLTLQDKLRFWAKNKEMVDNYYTEHGKDCNEAADELDKLEPWSWIAGYIPRETCS